MVVATENDWFFFGKILFAQLGDDVVGEVVECVVSLRLVAYLVLVFREEGQATLPGSEGVKRLIFPRVIVQTFRETFSNPESNPSLPVGFTFPILSSFEEPDYR